MTRKTGEVRERFKCSGCGVSLVKSQVDWCFETIAGHSGTLAKRIERLGDFTLAQLRRKLTGQWGERSTVTRAIQRVVRSVVEWETLADKATPGHFKAAALISTASEPLQLWFIRACLQAGRLELMEADRLLSQPLYFPFMLTIRKAELRRSTNFAIHRQGIDMDMVALADEAKPTQRSSGAKRKVAKQPV